MEIKNAGNKFVLGAVLAAIGGAIIKFRFLLGQMFMT